MDNLYDPIDKFFNYNKKVIQFLIPIRPIPKQSARFTTRYGKMISYQPKKIVEAKKTIQKYISNHILESEITGLPTDKEIGISVIFCFKKNKTEKIYKPIFRKKKPDLTDNLMKLVVDAMTGIVYNDDSQIVAVKSAKFTSFTDYIDIRIYY